MSLIMYCFQYVSASECSDSPIFVFYLYTEGSGLIIARPHELRVSFCTPPLPWVLVITLSCVSECVCIGTSYFIYSSEVRAGGWVLEATRNAFLLKWATTRVFIDGTESSISPLWTIEVFLLSRIFKDVFRTWLFPPHWHLLHLRDFLIQVQLFDLVHVYTLSLLGTIAPDGPWW